MKYILERLFESSTWIGLAVIISTFFAPKWFIILLGVALIISGDTWLKTWIRLNMPTFAKWVQEITK